MGRKLYRAEVESVKRFSISRGSQSIISFFQIYWGRKEAKASSRTHEMLNFSIETKNRTAQPTGYA